MSKRERDDVNLNADDDQKAKRMKLLEKLKATKLALQNKIKEESKNTPKKETAKEEKAENKIDIPNPFVYDRREEESQLEYFPAPTKTFTSSYNQRVQKKPSEAKQKQDLKRELKSANFDIRLKVRAAGNSHKSKPLNFYSQGQFIKQLEKEEEKKNREKLKEEGKLDDIESSSEESEEETSNPNTIALGSRSLQNNFASEVPDVEWWDVPFLYERDYPIIYDAPGVPAEDKNSFQMRDFIFYDTYPLDKPAVIPQSVMDANSEKIRYSKITDLIDHPPPKEMAPIKIAPMPSMMTKDERKKMRRRRREEFRKEQQERILEGLEPPLPNKVKLSNIMMVLAHEAIKDPTAVVKKVREEVEKRKANHEARNQERKLTPEERKKKKIAKYIEDAKLGLYAVLFVIHHLEGSNTYAKIWRNAIAYQLTGCCVTTPKHAVIVVEGGQKAMKKYKKLLLKRIKWEEIGEHNFCKLVWEGPISKNLFKGFKCSEFKKESAAHNYFTENHAEHYWKILSNQKSKDSEALSVAMSLLDDDESENETVPNNHEDIKMESTA